MERLMLETEDWRAFQAKDWAGYKERGSARGYFSVPEFKSTELLADLLAGVEGPVLDVGCGVLPMPNYLKKCKQPYGIDPFPGDEVRGFPFVQAMGEALPFQSNWFAATFLMSSLDHTLSPRAVICECWRVLRKKGLLFIWYKNKWEKDAYHPWTFTTGKILDILDYYFEWLDQMHYKAGPGYSKTDLMITRKVQ